MENLSSISQLDLNPEPLSRFKGFSGKDNPFLKDKSSETLAREINSLHDRILNEFSDERIRVLSSITQRPYNCLPKYIEDNFKELSLVYLENVNGARDLTIALIVSRLTNNPYISLIREKISRLAIQNLYDSTWSEAVIAVKCSYSKTHLLTFFLERYSFRTIQGWFKEKNKLFDTLLNPKTRYTVNDNPEVQEQRTIGVGYKDKGASTPEHEKSPEIQDSRSHVDIVEFKLTQRVSFDDSLNLMSLGLYSSHIKLKVKKFKLQEVQYEQYNAEVRQERIDSGRELKPTEGPGKTDRSEDRSLPVKNMQSTGGNYTSSSRQNQKKSSGSYFGIFNFEEIKRRITGNKSIE